MKIDIEMKEGTINIDIPDINNLPFKRFLINGMFERNINKIFEQGTHEVRNILIELLEEYISNLPIKKLFRFKNKYKLWDKQMKIVVSYIQPIRKIYIQPIRPIRKIKGCIVNDIEEFCKI